VRRAKLVGSRLPHNAQRRPPWSEAKSAVRPRPQMAAKTGGAPIAF